jgi:hypothetical protein
MKRGMDVPVDVPGTLEASMHSSVHTSASGSRYRKLRAMSLRDAFEADDRQVLPACEVARG